MNINRFFMALIFSFLGLIAQNANANMASILEAQEAQMDAMREYCASLMYKRLNAARSNLWRDLVNQAKSYADACRTVEDRFALSRSYEDMAYGLTMLNDHRQALRWAQACLDSNGQAVGCYARKAELLWHDGKTSEARSVISRAIMAGEQAIGMTKVEMERVRQRKPDPRAEPIYRKQYMRLWEQLESRLSALDESLQTVKSMQDGMDADGR